MLTIVGKVEVVLHREAKAALLSSVIGAKDGKTGLSANELFACQHMLICHCNT